MEIIYTGTEENMIEIYHALPGKARTKCIRSFEKSIVIPTDSGAKQVFEGETIVILNGIVTIK